MLQQAGVFEPEGPAPVPPPPFRRQPSRRAKKNETATLFQKHCKSAAGVFYSRVGARPRMFARQLGVTKTVPKLTPFLGAGAKSLQTQIQNPNPQNAFKSPQFSIISSRFPFPNLSCAFSPPRKNNCIRVKNPPAPRENLKPITNAAGIRTYFSDSPRHLRASNAPVAAEAENSLHRGK